MGWMMVGTIALTLFAGIFASIEIGYRIGMRLLARGHTETATGYGAVEAALYALLGLLLAFTFSAAASRYEGRRALAVEEVNDIGTAYLRIDLLPTGFQPRLREAFGHYVDERRAMYGSMSDPVTYNSHRARMIRIQQDIWTQAVAASFASDRATVLTAMVPAINAMIDVTTSRAEALRHHTPLPVLILLITLAMICSVAAGNSMAGPGGRGWLHMIGFALVIAATITIILDYEYPRLGLIRVDGSDVAMTQLRDTMP